MNFSLSANMSAFCSDSHIYRALVVTRKTLSHAFRDTDDPTTIYAELGVTRYKSNALRNNITLVVTK